MTSKTSVTIPAARPAAADIPVPALDKVLLMFAQMTPSEGLKNLQYLFNHFKLREAKYPTDGKSVFHTMRTELKSFQEAIEKQKASPDSSMLDLDKKFNHDKVLLWIMGRWQTVPVLQEHLTSQKWFQDCCRKSQQHSQPETLPLVRELCEILSDARIDM